MKSCILLTGTGVRRMSSVTCGFSSIKIHYSVNRINEVYVFFKMYEDYLLSTIMFLTHTTARPATVTSSAIVV